MSRQNAPREFRNECQGQCPKCEGEVRYQQKELTEQNVVWHFYCPECKLQGKEIYYLEYNESYAIEARSQMCNYGNN